MRDENGFLEQIRFSHGLSLGQATARGLGVVTAGIAFVLLGEAVASVGPLTPLAVFLAALLMAINSLCYTELALSTAASVLGIRPGGAYTLIHEKLGGGALSFLSGWALSLSGVGLCGLLAQGAARHLSLLLSDAFGTPVPAGLLGMALVTLVVLANSLGGWRGRRLPLTVLLGTLLVVLILAAIPLQSSAAYAATYSPQPGPAVALLTAAFVGLEIITGHQGDIRHRKANLPLALPGALILATVLGIGLAVVAGPWAEKEAGAPLVPLGEAIAGTPGRIAIIVLGNAALLLSLSRVLTLVTRHLYVMSQDGFLPAWLRQTNSRRRTPTRLALLIGLLVMPVVWIPAGFLSRIGGLLYLLVLMAVNLTLVRQRREKTPSRFALPFHPWIPALTLAVDLLAISLWGLEPAAWVAGCLAVGVLFYLAYARTHHIKAKEGVTVFRPPTDEQAAERFRVLVPIANPATATTLLRIAGQLAQFQGGEATALHIVVVPEPVPLETGRRQAKTGRTVLEKALALANEERLPIQIVTRIARGVAQGILDTAAEEKADLILLGWQGPTRSRGTSLGRIVDAVLRDASCDVLIVQGEHISPLSKILVPTAGGRHAQATTRLAGLLMKALQAKVTFAYVQPGPTTPQQMEENRRRIAKVLDRSSMKPPPEQKVVTSSSVVEGIVQEAQGYDLVLLGVSEETLLDQFVFGSIPLQVAARVPTTALVQGYQGITRIWSRRLLRALRATLPILNREEQLEVQREIARGARPGVNFFVLIVLSCIIAALGLLLNSPAVVIGAMLVAPLMSPILGFSLGLVLGDLRLIRFSVEAILKGIALAVVIATFIGLLSPLKTITGEMLARGQPTLLDMAVALASGMAGGYALARKDVSAALPGVAIAAALMPPLATVGLAISLGDARTAGGALLLFLTNTAAISLAAGVVFLLLGMRPQRWEPESRRRLWQRLTASLLLLLAIAIPLGIIMADIIRDTAQEQAVRETITQHLAAGDSQLVTLEMERRGADLLIVATIRSVQPFDEEAVDHLAGTLNEQLGHPVQLEVVVLPVVRSEPAP